MAGTITFRSGEETGHGLDVLTREGASRPAAIRHAVPGADGWLRPRHWALMICLGSAAVVRAARAEPESSALRAWPNERAGTGRISSVLTEPAARITPSLVTSVPDISGSS